MPKSVLGRVKSEKAPRVLLVDAHSVYRAGLRSILAESMPGAEVFESGDLAAGLCQLASVGPLDLVLIDLDLSTLRSARQLREAFEAHPQTRFAIISGADSRESILASLSVGFHGFISKHQLADEVLAAINDIASGRIYVPPMLANPGEDERPPTIAGEINFRPLTPRQREVLSLLALGKSNKEIGRVLHIAEATAKVHTAALLRVLRARNRTEVAIKARRLLEALHAPSPAPPSPASTLRTAPPARARASDGTVNGGGKAATIVREERLPFKVRLMEREASAEGPGSRRK